MGQCHALDDKNKIMSIDYEICVSIIVHMMNKY